MNAFFVPQLGSQIYTMPGMSTRLNLMAAEPGEYPGLSTNFSGDGFSDMQFTVTAVPAGRFEAQLALLGAGAPPLDAAALADVIRRGSSPARAFTDPDPQLYQRLLQPSARR